MTEATGGAGHCLGQKLADGSGLDPKDTSSVLANDPGATITYNGGPNGAELSVPVTNGGTVTATAGTLYVYGPVTNSGTITASVGTLNFGNSYAPSSAATLTIGISGNKKYGRLSVNGTATLAGTLALQTSSSYIPAIGTSLTILTATNRTGTFSNITGTQLSGEHWVVSYSPTHVILKAVSG